MEKLVALSVNSEPVNSEPLVSIIINNYNYGRFLNFAIDSALNQTYPHIEVIVVDDGSTDNSREIIASYGERVIPLFKENGGHASTFNAGFKICHGEIVCFLDSDDLFCPDKVEECVRVLVEKMQNNPLVMVYHLLEIVDQAGNSLERFEPTSIWNYPPNLYEHALKYRFFPYPAAPTTGDAFSRKLLEAVLPIPERGKNYLNNAAENVVVRAAALLGEVHAIDKTLAKYRHHGDNSWHGTGWNPDKFREFTTLRDNFLNQKLKEYQKEPIISFFDSMDSKYYYQQANAYDEVIKLAVRVIQWRISPESLVFFVKAFIQYCLWLINPKFVQLKEK
ncbi:MAG TPA: glycosyltransferase [Coleofasciculaceae cyanobacterium]